MLKLFNFQTVCLPDVIWLGTHQESFATGDLITTLQLYRLTHSDHAIVGMIITRSIEVYWC